MTDYGALCSVLVVVGLSLIVVVAWSCCVVAARADQWTAEARDE